ncbi:thiamine thiazole synthase [Striga asiatica]|uniref:Thiamine thiazole synthase n=1 Tax=Striga asiatica TaxID=4170 RepID=A0A5A7R8X6_STRAF|nr:thiamine thiazole synthase [Striga asiatica]
MPAKELLIDPNREGFGRFFKFSTSYLCEFRPTATGPQHTAHSSPIAPSNPRVSSSKKNEQPSVLLLAVNPSAPSPTLDFTPRRDAARSYSHRATYLAESLISSPYEQLQL